jgi:hypothetical protein
MVFGFQEEQSFSILRLGRTKGKMYKNCVRVEIIFPFTNLKESMPFFYIFEEKLKFGPFLRDFYNKFLYLLKIIVNKLFDFVLDRARMLARVRWWGPQCALTRAFPRPAEMFKWFGGSSPSNDADGPHEVVTDDPLATISLSLPRVRRIQSSKKSRAKARRTKEIYAVSR